MKNKTKAKIYTIYINEINEDWDIYYLGTSKDIDWYMCEGNTIQEVIDATPDIVSDLSEARAERIQKKAEAEKEKIDYTRVCKLHYSFTSAQHFTLA